MIAKSLTLPYNEVLTTLNKKAFESIMGKGHDVGYQHFYLFSQCLPFCQGHKSSFELHLNCHLQMLSIWTSLRIVHVVWSEHSVQENPKIYQRSTLLPSQRKKISENIWRKGKRLMKKILEKEKKKNLLFTFKEKFQKFCIVQLSSANALNLNQSKNPCCFQSHHFVSGQKIKPLPVMTLKQSAFENIVGKGEIDNEHQCLLYPHSFLSYQRKK